MQALHGVGRVVVMRTPFPGRTPAGGAGRPADAAPRARARSPRSPRSRTGCRDRGDGSARSTRRKAAAARPLPSGRSDNTSSAGSRGAPPAPPDARTRTRLGQNGPAPQVDLAIARPLPRLQAAWVNVRASDALGGMVPMLEEAAQVHASGCSPDGHAALPRGFSRANWGRLACIRRCIRPAQIFTGVEEGSGIARKWG